MMLNEAIELCKLHVRRNTFLTESDWRALLNQSAQELQKMTHVLVKDFRINLMELITEYDMGRAYRILEDGRYGTEKVRRVSREQILDLDSEETGTPRYIYEVGTFTVGVWPVPDASCTGTGIIVRCNYYPDEITETTPLTSSLPFEVADHPTVVMGAVLMAERIDTDLNISEVVRRDYEQGILSMRARASNRMPGTKVLRRVT